MRKSSWITLILLLLCYTIQAQQGTEPVRVTDLLKIRSASSITLSPDGANLVFVVTSIEPDGDSKLDYTYQGQLWIAPTDGSSPARPLTSKENASQPTWSPDGKQLAFVRAAGGKPQLFLLGMNGGEAIQLTSFKYGASSPSWSPDGKKLLFTAGIPFNDLLKDSLLNPNKGVPAWSLEKPGFANNQYLQATAAKADPDGNMEQVRAYLENNVRDKKATVLNKLQFQDEMTINSGLSFSHIFLVDARPGATPVAITKGFARFNSAAFSPDGSSILLAGAADSSTHPDRNLESAIYSVAADGSQLKKLLGEKGKVFGSPRLSPSGKWLAFLVGTTSFVSVQQLALLPMDKAGAAYTLLPFDRSKGNLTWSQDEQYLYFTAQSNGGVPLYRADISSKQVQRLTDSSTGISSFALEGNTLAYVQTAVSNPYEVFVADASAGKPRQLSQLNQEWVSKKRLSMPEKFSFINKKGQPIEYWVMKPANYEPGNKYPLVLEIHGGPSAMWGPGESSMWHEYQFYSSKGYGVVYCNPRGSGGYGEQFLRSNINDWGAGPSSDVLTALDKAVAQGWADTSKLLVTGGSYAGYLVAWIIAHDHRFKAACSQRGVYDLPTFFGEGNAWRLVPNYFGGYPWDPKVKTVLQRESPINYVQNITTPYIIFHGDNDRRTGFVQSEMLYRSLKVLDRPVEYVRHPNGTHELTRSGDNRQRIDQLLRTWEFFERYIR
ncbi:MAG: S9 family peptidase [Candidatus Pseudobacter hemicellulosilyticus]|uniref:S9 family peptidase n=1 Tax=Candidatus Pseudobacter hemicellulosilyticus TaxID=3121375 RepID=A0AAJ5WW93_9BACT|nr:MAG: S9 family peptidase [Pseudobacter sp.]